MRWRLDLAYDGTDFSGWAVQPGRRTVQGELERWLPQVLRLSEPVTLTCAGRTDAGVHARGQVAHVDLPDDCDASVLEHRLRRVLPPDVVIWAARPAPPGFDARFSALWRRYCYRLADRPLDPLLRGHVVAVREPLDLEALNAAGRALLGLHDFAAFCRRRDGATTIRTLLDLRALRRTDGVVEVEVRADAFCHSMVRSLMGAVTAVATGRRDLRWLESVRGSPVRHSEIQVLPAHGLVLEEVCYPADEALAGRAEAARRERSAAEVEEPA